MTQAEKKEYAYMLYTKNEGLTQQEIAKRVEVHPNTITRWKIEDEWDRSAGHLLTTKQEQLRRLYAQLKELNDHIVSKEEGKRFANKGESDTITQITRAIKSLETKLSPGTVIDVFTPFINFVAKVDGEMAKKIVELQHSFVQSL
ncbi:MAG: DDE transposase family protein [Bacteroidetes bacterium]|nr:MAG: DDE transposase family protein [Bacteroidota bacterium]